MTNYFIEVLNNLLNYGISEDEKLSSEERIKRVIIFKKNFNFEFYLELFKNVELYILDTKINNEEKEDVIILLFHVLRSFNIFEENISLTPLIIKQIYNSYLSFLNMNILFEWISSNKVVCIQHLKNIINDYMEFLKNPENVFFIHYLYGKIICFNKKLDDFLDTPSQSGLSYRNSLDDVELLFKYSKTISTLYSTRNRKRPT